MADEKSLIVKANKLIEARYKLNLNEQKIILYAVSKLNKNEEKFNILEVDVREFTSLIGTTQERYSEIKEVVSSLMSKQVRIDTQDRDLIANWVSSIEYIKDTGKIEIEFSEKLTPYLLQLKKHFTQYKLKNILYLKNKYSIRIYELLKQYEKIGNRQFELEQFKTIIGCEGKHQRFNNFRDRVLEPVKTELCDYTDICFEYEKITKGRKVVGIKFIIKDNGSQNKNIDVIMDFEEIKNKSGLEKENYNSEQLLELYEIAVRKTEGAEANPYLYIRLNYKYMIENGTARNKFTYLKKSLENDYAKAIVKIGTGYDIK